MESMFFTSKQLSLSDLDRGIVSSSRADSGLPVSLDLRFFFFLLDIRGDSSLFPWISTTSVLRFLGDFSFDVNGESLLFPCFSTTSLLRFFGDCIKHCSPIVILSAFGSNLDCVRSTLCLSFSFIFFGESRFWYLSLTSFGVSATSAFRLFFLCFGDSGKLSSVMWFCSLFFFFLADELDTMSSSTRLDVRFAFSVKWKINVFCEHEQSLLLQTPKDVPFQWHGGISNEFQRLSFHVLSKVRWNFERLQTIVYLIAEESLKTW